MQVAGAHCEDVAISILFLSCVLALIRPAKSQHSAVGITGAACDSNSRRRRIAFGLEMRFALCLKMCPPRSARDSQDAITSSRDAMNASCGERRRWMSGIWSCSCATLCLGVGPHRRRVGCCWSACADVHALLVSEMWTGINKRRVEREEMPHLRGRLSS